MKRLEVLGLDEKKVQHVVVDLSLLLADLQVFYSNLSWFPLGRKRTWFLCNAQQV